MTPYFLNVRNAKIPDTFFFVDPPYFNAEMGHYGGYTADDFENLLKVLERVKGKFLLTTYPSDLLEKYTLRNNWLRQNNVMHLSASNIEGKTKNEVFTLNYTPNIGQGRLF